MGSVRHSRGSTALDLYSGCGGLTVGLKQAGFSVLAGVELDGKAAETYAANHPDVKLINRDIRDVCPEDLRQALRISRGDLDVLAGCPPCQGFSRLRTKNGKVSGEDNRNRLVFQFLKFVDAFYPKAIMVENVPALAENRIFDEFLQEISSRGYGFDFSVFNAADFGVPQRRKRLILLASRIGDSFPAPTDIPRRTVRDAIGMLPDVGEIDDALHNLPENRSEKVIRLIASIPKDGGSRRDLSEEEQLACHRRVNGFYDVYGRMAWDDVSPTITGGCYNPSRGRFLHPQKNRTITLREAALLQGFPESYQFNVRHGKDAIALMIGNALPPPLVRAHAMRLRLK